MTDDFPVLIFQRQFPYGKKAVGKGSIVRPSRQPVGEDADDIIAAGLGVFLHFCDEPVPDLLRRQMEDTVG